MGSLCFGERLPRSVFLVGHSSPTSRAPGFQGGGGGLEGEVGEGSVGVTGFSFLEKRGPRWWGENGVRKVAGSRQVSAVCDDGPKGKHGASQ